jgi:hypothetical protein
VRRTDIKAGAKILNFHMLMVKKYLANGSFNKMKATFVADGRDQDAELFLTSHHPQ